MNQEPIPSLGMTFAPGCRPAVRLSFLPVIPSEAASNREVRQNHSYSRVGLSGGKTRCRNLTSRQFATSDPMRVVRPEGA